MNTGAFSIRRAFVRAALLVTHCVAAAAAYPFAMRNTAEEELPRARARWLQRLCRKLCGAMGITVEHEGYPRNGLIVSNHLSYLDILAFGSLVPCAFVSKQEVRAWPLIGFLAARAGTVFVDRGRKTGVAESLGSMRRVIGASVPLLLFPEGTSSGGDSVLPFRASLLQAASEAAAVTPAAIDYHFEYGSVENEVCYWRDMTFGPHIWNLLGTPGLTALVRFGAPHPAEADRKRLAAGLRRSVMALRNNGHVETAGGPHPAVARCGERHHV